MKICFKKFRPHQYAVFEKKMFVPCACEEMSGHFETAHGSFLILYQMVLLSNINFLMCKQNET